jgi:hypothetical protein
LLGGVGSDLIPLPPTTTHSVGCSQLLSNYHHNRNRRSRAQAEACHLFQGLPPPTLKQIDPPVWSDDCTWSQADFWAFKFASTVGQDDDDPLADGMMRLRAPRHHQLVFHSRPGRGRPSIRFVIPQQTPLNNRAFFASPCS